MKRWLSFQGRASRGEYWSRTCGAMLLFFFAGVFLIVLAGIGVPVIDARLGLQEWVTDAFALVLLALLILVSVWYVWVVLAVSVRRLHDLGFEGKAGFRSLRASLQAGYARGTPGPNQYGPDPLG